MIERRSVKNIFLLKGVWVVAQTDVGFFDFEPEVATSKSINMSIAFKLEQLFESELEAIVLVAKLETEIFDSVKPDAGGSGNGAFEIFSGVMDEELNFVPQEKIWEKKFEFPLLNEPAPES